MLRIYSFRNVFVLLNLKSHNLQAKLPDSYSEKGLILFLGIPDDNIHSSSAIYFLDESVCAVDASRILFGLIPLTSRKLPLSHKFYSV